MNICKSTSTKITFIILVHMLESFSDTWIFSASTSCDHCSENGVNNEEFNISIL
jgi:hypothetical protein